MVEINTNPLKGTRGIGMLLLLLYKYIGHLISLLKCLRSSRWAFAANQTRPKMGQLPSLFNSMELIDIYVYKLIDTKYVIFSRQQIH